MKFSKRALGLGVLGSYFLGRFQKKKKNHQSKFSIPSKNSSFSKKKNENKNFINKNFQFLEKIQNFQIFRKKKFINQNFQFLQENSSFPNSKKKKKKKSSLNSSPGTESYDLLPHFPMVQHQVNCPPSTFIEAWNMSKTRSIRQVCQLLFNE